MTETIRWGIAGTGRIADVVASDFTHVPDAELVAVGSRDVTRAARFAERHRIPTAHGTYQDLVTDPQVDVIYIATPHPQHRDIALAALENDKAILVEKAFTATLAGAAQVVARARDRKVFAMEAMWTRFLPLISTARKIIDDGIIGEPRSVQADLGALRPFNPEDRLFHPDLGGGAMLDLGVYLVSLAEHFLGEPTTVHAIGDRYPNGVDSSFALTLGHQDGRISSLTGSLAYNSPGRAFIAGTHGWIGIQPRFHHPTELVLSRQSHADTTATREPLGRGYAHELIEVTHCLRQGKLESDIMPLDSTLSVQRILDEACAQLGVRHHEAPVEFGPGT